MGILSQAQLKLQNSLKKARKDVKDNQLTEDTKPTCTEVSDWLESKRMNNEIVSDWLESKRMNNKTSGFETIDESGYTLAK